LTCFQIETKKVAETPTAQTVTKTVVAVSSAVAVGQGFPPLFKVDFFLFKVKLIFFYNQQGWH
jgi:hypothetical protein